MKANNYIAFILFCLLSIVSWTQEPSIKLEVSSQSIQVGERIKVQYTANKNCKINLPRKFENFTTLAGPMQAKSYSHQVINGHMSSTEEYVISYILTPTKKGDFKLPKATLTCDGKSVESNEITIYVATGNQPKTAQPDENYFCIITANKSSAYVGEPIVLTYKVYSRYRIHSLPGLTFGKVENGWHQDLDPNYQPQLVEETYKGVRYYAVKIKSEVCMANNLGKIKVSPYELDVILQTGMFQTVQKKITSNSLEINIKPFPDGAPENFNGAVGDFAIEASVTKDQLKAGEGFDLKIKIKGKGNLHLTEQIVPDIPETFDMFDPDIDDSFNYNRNGSMGSINYSYLITPGKEGDYTLGPFTFSFFDINTKKYKTVSTDSFPIQVDKGDGTYNPYAAIKKTSTDTVNTLRYIQTDEPYFFTEDDYWAKSWWFYSMLSLLPLTIFAGIWTNKRKEKTGERTVKTRHSKANKFAVKRLKDAKVFLDNSDYVKFHEELSKSMYQYVTDKFSLPSSQHDKQIIKDAFVNHNVSDASSDQFIELIEESEMARFSNLPEDANQDIYDQAITIIEKIEKEAKS